MNFTYETDRLLLKICGQEIAPQVLDFFENNADIFEKVEPISGPEFFTLEHQKNILNYEYSHMLGLSMVRFWLFEKSNPDQIIGTIAFRNIARPVYSSCQMGYKMDRNYTGKGYCKEALAAGIEIVFEELDLHRIEAMVMPGNLASIHILESLGFEREGLMRQKVCIQDHWEDHYLYSLLRS